MVLPELAGIGAAPQSAAKDAGLRNRGRALYRDYLYETVWGDDGTGCDTRTLDTHIARLRRKLNLGDRLHSVRQIGYMLEKE